jgi:hypothetical protein
VELMSHPGRLICSARIAATCGVKPTFSDLVELRSRSMSLEQRFSVGALVINGNGAPADFKDTPK